MAPKVAAVKYACNGEIAGEFEIPAYKVYNLQPTHDIFEKGEVSELSRLIGMPLVLERLRPSLLKVYHAVTYGPGGRRPQMPWKGGRKVKASGGNARKTAYASYDYKPEADYFPNDTAAKLMIACSEGKGAALLLPPSKWIDKVGSVLIARQDKVLLHPMHIEIFKAFITAIYQELTVPEKGQVTAGAIAALVTPEMWHAYWQMVIDHMVKTGQQNLLVGVPCPYKEPIAVEADAEDADEGGVQLGGDSDMMDCSNLGFTQ